MLMSDSWYEHAHHAKDLPSASSSTLIEIEVNLMQMSVWVSETPHPSLSSGVSLPLMSYFPLMFTGCWKGNWWRVTLRNKYI